MEKLSVATIKANIKKKNFDWVAAKTSVADLPEEEKDRLLGYHANEKELDALGEWIKSVEKFTAMQPAQFALPAAVDWRNKNGNWVTSVKDQSSCGSCVSFATCATIESAIRIACGSSTMAVDLSEAYQFFCGCGNCCASGWNFQPSLDFAKNTGVALETHWPYQPTDQPCKTNVPIYTRITGWNRQLTVNERKTALVNKGPLVAGMAVYSDFYNYSSGVYRRTSNDLRGYHAICVVGYDDGHEAWICKNSWGTGWGENGFFRIGYGECDIDARFPFYSVDVTCPTEPRREVCRRYVPYLRRVIRAARTNVHLRACLRYYICRRRPRPNPRICTRYSRVIRSVAIILRRCPQYRRPFCRLIG